MEKCLLVVLLSFAAALAPGVAQSYPDKPVRFIVPYAPGGSSDTIGRLLGEKLRIAMGVPFVIDNRPGAGSMIGTDIAAKSMPDGYTIILSDMPHTINPGIYAKVPYDPVRDFSPITLIGVSPLFLFVTPSSPEKNLKEFIAYAKAAPRKVAIGSGGNGSTPHLMIGMLQTLTGAEFSHVPYKGSGPAVADVAAGHIRAVFATMATAAPLANAGRLRAIAVSSPARNALLPDVPTFAEGGVPGIVVEQWWGVMAPAAVPRPIIDRLHAEITKALAAADVRERFAVLALEPKTNTPAQFRALLESEVQRWGKAARDAGVALN